VAERRFSQTAIVDGYEALYRRITRSSPARVDARQAELGREG
jgi:hypothetical protein